MVHVLIISAAQDITSMHSSRMSTVRCSSRFLWGGGSARGGVSQHTLRQTPPLHLPPPPLWTEFLTHACENITLPQAHLSCMYSSTCNTVARNFSCRLIIHPKMSLFWMSDRWYQNGQETFLLNHCELHISVMKAEIRTAFPLISLKTKIPLFSSIFFQLFETYFHLYFKTTFCQYYFYMVPDTESDKKNGFCRAVHTAHTRPTQIPTRFCANLSISASCVYIRLGVGQGEHTITNLTAVKKKGLIYVISSFSITKICTFIFPHFHGKFKIPWKTKSIFPMLVVGTQQKRSRITTTWQNMISYLISARDEKKQNSLFEQSARWTCYKRKPGTDRTSFPKWNGCSGNLVNH